MCDDLIATHFFVSSINGSTKIPTETPGAHVFFQNPPLNTLWVFVPPGFEPVQLDSWLNDHLADHPAGKGFAGWSVNTYSKDIALRLHKEWHAASFDVLYEMRLRVPSGSVSAHFCPAGFTIREDPTYSKSLEPDRFSEAFLEQEKTYTIIDEQTDRVAGFATFVVDDEGKRIYVSSIEVFPSYRRRGLAKALMQQYVQWEKQGYAIWLTVFAENIGAVAMYFGLGFGVERCIWVVGGSNP